MSKGGGRLSKNMRQYWDDVKSDRKRMTDSGGVDVREAKGRIQIIAPYNARFHDGMIELGARWRYRSQCWSAQRVSKRLVAKLIRECFGDEHIPRWMWE